MRTIIKTPYWIWPAELSDSLCDAIIEEGNKLTEIDAKVRLDKDKGEISTTTRETKISWYPEDCWVSDIINGYLIKANKLAGWNFNITTNENVQFGKYTKGSFYRWHQDVINTVKYRKLSVTVQLSAPTDYEGGDFEIKDFWKTKKLTFKEDIRKRGTIIIFPSLLSHQVTPVTKGTRYSLVQWYSGPDFV